ncbi:MAG: ABC transporter permease [Solirubrobacteraceae bacterium]
MSDLPDTVPPVVGDPATADRSSSELIPQRDRRAWLRGALEQLGPFLFVLVLGIVLTIVSPYFLTSTNISAIFVQMSVIAIITVGETMVIITAGIDLSVSTVVALSGVMASMLVANDGMGTGLGMVIGVLVGGGVGLINGLLITAVRLPPFIATLGTLSAVGGVALLVTNGQPIAAPTSFDVLGDGHIGPIPVPIVIMVLVAAAGWFVLARTTLGRSAYAIGSNYETARLSGIRVNRVLTSVYVIQGLLAGLGGVIVASRVVTGDPSAGTNYNLDAIAAAVIGGASLFGGEGSVIGGLIGALLMELISNGSDLLNISNFWQDVILGVVIIAAVAYDQFRRRALRST